MPTQPCPTCGADVTRVTITIGQTPFAEPCCCPVAVTMTAGDRARLDPADRPGPAANPRLALAGAAAAR